MLRLTSSRTRATHAHIRSSTRLATLNDLDGVLGLVDPHSSARRGLLGDLADRSASLRGSEHLTDAVTVDLNQDSRHDVTPARS